MQINKTVTQTAAGVHCSKRSWFLQEKYCSLQWESFTQMLVISVTKQKRLWSDDSLILPLWRNPVWTNSIHTSFSFWLCKFITKIDLRIALSVFFTSMKVQSLMWTTQFITMWMYLVLNHLREDICTGTHH